MTGLSLSVVIPTFNRAHLIGRAIRSVISQLNPNDELVVIDDGSTDHTESVVTGFGDPRVCYFKQAHGGAGVARNRGVRQATGHSGYIGDLYRGTMHHNYFSIVCTMIRRRDAGDSIRFAEGVATYEECECFGRISRRGLAAFLDFAGALQHKHPGPRLTDADWVARAESRLTILNKVWGSDPQFLARYDDEYRALVRQTRLARVRGLLVLGRPQDARDEIRSLDFVPLLYRAASYIPAMLIRPAVALTRNRRNWLMQEA